jgi:hypothetical protein
MKFAMRTTLGLLMFCFLLTNAYAQQPVFYFAAHEDDWQLFMGKQAFVDSGLGVTGVKMVFITLTAGDAGCGAGCLGTNGTSTPYYIARENGSIASVKLLADYQNNYPTDMIQSTATPFRRSLIATWWLTSSDFLTGMHQMEPDMLTPETSRFRTPAIG